VAVRGSVAKLGHGPASSLSSDQRRTLLQWFGLGCRSEFIGPVRLTADRPEGTEVRLRHGEARYDNGPLYTENLTSALQTDTFVLAGAGEEMLEPAFAFHGFRYVEVTGLPDPP
jgi:hypothetical protein